MRIQRVSAEPIHYLPYLKAGTGGKTETAQLPIFEGRVDALPASLEAIICTSDLQGVATSPRPGQASELLGEVLADELAVLLDMLSIAAGQTGVVLSGDFFSAAHADQRGATGDVRRVWTAFQQKFRWVAGVLGNHDQLGFTADDLEIFVSQPNVYYLDGAVRLIDGWTLAGISGIIGNPAKPLRRSADEYLSILARLYREKPDLILLHQSPAVVKLGRSGSAELGVFYAQQRVYPLTVCGHVSWPLPLAELDNGAQILNVDSRAIILRSSGS